MSKVKLGFVGTGFMGQVAHLANYAVLDDCQVVALAEPRKELADLVASRYGIENVYSNHKELLNEAKVDGIIASQPFNRHIKIIPDIIKAGIPVFTEKPVAVSVEAGTILADLAEKENVVHMVGYHKRSDPAMEYARELIEEWKNSQEYGKMKYVRITMPPGDWIAGGNAAFLNTDEPYPAGDSENKPEYFDDETYDKYNAFVNYYIHQVNALRYIFGESYKLKYSDENEIIIVTESESNVCGTIEMAPYTTSVSWDESIFVGFEKAYIKINLPAPLVSQKAGELTIMTSNPEKGSQKIKKPVMPHISAMRNQAMNFISVLKGEKQPPCDSREAVEDLKIALDYINYIK